MKTFTTWMALCLFLLAAETLFAQKFDEKFEHWPVNLKINGTIIVDCGLKDDEAFDSMFRRAKEKKATIYVAGDVELGTATRLLKRFTENEVVSSIATFEKITDKTFEEALAEQDIVAIYAGTDLSESDFAGIAKLKKQFEEFLARRGVLMVDAEMAKALSQYFVEPNAKTLIHTGCGLLPDCAICTQFKNDKSHRSRLLSILGAHPRSVGIGIEDNTALVLTGRKIRVVGDGQATFMLMANEQMPLRIQTIGKMKSRRQAPQEWLVDLTEWRRDAIDRTIDPFPPAKPDPPVVENGTLIIVGGGGMPRGLMSQMIEMAGGLEKAKMVYVPCSESDDVSERQRTVDMWKRMGVKHATFIHTKDRNKANNDEEFLAPLMDATGIWFGGGRQWNFADSYYGTKAHQLMKEVLHRGGVIGGSSAGASIQARYLARATPIGNFRIMAPGYERGGLGFISGVAIDQHFSQRGRQKDMTQLVNRYPQMLGIGIDEATALIVQKSQAKVVGRGKVFFYDRNLPVYPDKPDYISLPDGSIFDLAERKIMKDTTAEKEAEAKERAEKKKAEKKKSEEKEKKDKKKKDKAGQR